MTTGTGLAVRIAEEDDVPRICAFGAHHLPPHYTPLLGGAAAQAQVDRWWSEVEMRPAVRAGRVVVAVSGAEVVGVAQFDEAMTPPMIWKLYVDPSLRGRGIGPVLLDAVYALLPGDAETVGIEHFSMNERAGRFYDREGFAVERVEEAASGDPRQNVTWRVKVLR